MRAGMQTQLSPYARLTLGACREASGSFATKDATGKAHMHAHKAVLSQQASAEEGMPVYLQQWPHWLVYRTTGLSLT